MAKSGTERRFQSSEIVPALLSPKSISATELPASFDDDSWIRIFTEPVPHFTERHMSESLNAVWFAEASGSPCAAERRADSVVQSDKPVIRVYLEPAIQPATSRAEPNAMQTSVFASCDFTEATTWSSTNCSTFGSVTTYCVPFTDVVAAILLSGFHTVAFSAPSTMHVMASRPKMGVTMPRMIFACRVGPALIRGFSCSSCDKVIALAILQCPPAKA